VNIGGCEHPSLNAGSIWIALLPSVRMWSGWRHVLRIPLAKAAEATRGGHALFIACETAICSAASVPTTINRAPRIILSFGPGSKPDETDAS
jgi:hypothetical protein